MKTIRVVLTNDLDGHYLTINNCPSYRDAVRLAQIKYPGNVLCATNMHPCQINRYGEQTELKEIDFLNTTK